jgi:hypothetical protein
MANRNQSNTKRNQGRRQDDTGTQQSEPNITRQNRGSRENVNDQSNAQNQGNDQSRQGDGGNRGKRGNRGLG